MFVEWTWPKKNEGCETSQPSFCGRLDPIYGQGADCVGSVFRNEYQPFTALDGVWSARASASQESISCDTSVGSAS